MPVLGNLYPYIYAGANQLKPALSFQQEHFEDVHAWREETREVLRSLLFVNESTVPLLPELVDQTDYTGYTQQKWYFNAATEERIPAFVLRPRGLTRPGPAIVALHCHGGMYYFGKKKLIQEENEPALLSAYREQFYGGRALANELVERGYTVVVIDSFYFGERRIIAPPPEALQKELLLVAEGSDQWIALLNRVSAEMESLVAKSLYWSGGSWPGILVQDDMRSIDFLLTLPNVDPERIGCVGLSMGGLRAGLLGALDPRVKAVCLVGWMSTIQEMLEEKVAQHSWCCMIPGLPHILDWPDLVALHAPNPLMVMQGSHDELFTLAGFQKAAEKLRAIYAKAGMPGNLDIGTFDLPHTFSEGMQLQAWDFFAKMLEAGE